MKNFDNLLNCELDVGHSIQDPIDRSEEKSVGGLRVELVEKSFTNNWVSLFEVVTKSSSVIKGGIDVLEDVLRNVFGRDQKRFPALGLYL